jgi:hypothetical protein
VVNALGVRAAARIRTGLTLGLVLPTLMLGGCVWQRDYDALKAQNDQLQQKLTAQQQQLSASQEQVVRLQGAIKYTVNSDLLFMPGSWQMKPGAEKIIASFAQKNWHRHSRARFWSPVIRITRLSARRSSARVLIPIRICRKSGLTQ